MRKLKVCPECETEFDSEVCPECECSRKYSELENQALELVDELSDCLSDLELAKKTVEKYEKAVADVRERIFQNNAALRDFKWWTAGDEIVNEFDEMKQLRSIR